MVEHLEFSLLYNTLAAIRKSRDGYNGVDDTCISTPLSVDRVEAVLKRIAGMCDVAGNTHIDNYDYADIGDNRLDVWGYADATPEIEWDDCDWRIIIRYDENG